MIRVAILVSIVVVFFLGRPLLAQSLSSGQTTHGEKIDHIIEKVLIRTGMSGDLSFHLELADTPGKRSLGLMYTKKLSRDGGMLFDFGSPQMVSMWMKNTYIPLDILFVSPNGRIDKIVEKAKPFDKTPIPSEFLVRAVVELKGGTVALFHIREGDYVQHKIFELRSSPFHD